MILFTYAGRVQAAAGPARRPDRGGARHCCSPGSSGGSASPRGRRPAATPARAAACRRRCPATCFACCPTPYAWQYLAVIVPMGLFNVIGSLQNLGERRGRRRPLRDPLLAAGQRLGTIVAALFGSPFPTTIYIGHPGWKAMGARSAYSVAQRRRDHAALSRRRGMAWVLQVVPLEATLGILLWIAVVMTAQAFTEVPREHASRWPSAWCPRSPRGSSCSSSRLLRIAGTSLLEAADGLTAAGVFIDGAVALSQGFLLTSMLLAAIVAHVTDRRLGVAALWTLAAAACSPASASSTATRSRRAASSRVCSTSSSARTPRTRPWSSALAYAAGAALLWVLALRERRGP